MSYDKGNGTVKHWSTLLRIYRHVHLIAWFNIAAVGNVKNFS